MLKIQTILILTGILVINIVIYTAFSIAAANLNMNNWHEASRGFYSLLFGIGNTLGIAMFFGIIYDSIFYNSMQTETIATAYQSDVNDICQKIKNPN